MAAHNVMVEPGRSQALGRDVVPEVAARGATRLEFEVMFPRLAQCVFNALTIPEYIELWSNTDGAAEVQASVELKTGSPFSIVAKRRRGVEYRVDGAYTMIRTAKRLECRWVFCSADGCSESRVRMDFLPVGAGTVLRIVQAGEWQGNEREAQRRWWQERLGRLRTLLA